MRHPAPTSLSQRSIETDFSGGVIISNGGVTLLRRADERLDLTPRLAACFTDHRRPELVVHAVETLVLQRVYGLALAHEDLNDHDELRRDPALQAVAGRTTPRRGDCAPLAGKSTLNRPELAAGRNDPKARKFVVDAGRMDELLVALCVEGYESEPAEVVLDLDATDIPLHGDFQTRENFRSSSALDEVPLVRGDPHGGTMEIMKTQPIGPITLMYCYSHKDSRHRQQMEDTLSPFHRQGLLKDWSDVNILPGESIPDRTQANLDTSNILVFLISQNFLASDECWNEWRRASKKPESVRVPIILAPCRWRDLPGIADIKALPLDAKPLTEYRPQAKAWKEVSDGILAVIESVRRTIELREPFRQQMEDTLFLSESHVKLRELFVFPLLSAYAARSGPDEIEEVIQTRTDLLKRGHLLIHGEHLSGKTALSRTLFLELVDEDGVPALYVDLAKRPGPPTDGTLRREYERAFTGDYSLWIEKPNKVILIDNLSRHVDALKFVEFVRTRFSTIIVTLATDVFYSYYCDDERLADFGEVRIQPLTHGKQEALIRKRVQSSSPGQPVLDGRIDQLEKQVNETVLANRLLPRYPFYVLSVLQTKEAFMPRDLTISSYGYCYHVLIIGYLVKSGISNSDADIAPCLNFAERLAFKIFKSESVTQQLGMEGMQEFTELYRSDFIIPTATLRRMCDPVFGIVTTDGEFRDRYMYFYFLGRYLARYATKEHGEIEGLLDESYRTDNALTLIFTIHHSNSDKLIEMIRHRTIGVLSEVEPAKLDKSEAELFETAIGALHVNVVSTNPVEAERARDRKRRDEVELEGGGEPLLDEPAEKAVEGINDLYRIFKNNEILGHILRNKYGTLERPKVKQLIEAIADGGLRLIRLLLLDEKEMHSLAVWIQKRHPAYSIDQIKKSLRSISLMWAIHNIERVVTALGKREICPTVEEVVRRRNSPAYDLIGYFLRLDTIHTLDDDDVKEVRRLLKKHRYPFFERLISLRTQFYLRRHRVSERKEQAMCSALGIRYRPRLKKLAAPAARSQ